MSARSSLMGLLISTIRLSRTIESMEKSEQKCARIEQGKDCRSVSEWNSNFHPPDLHLFALLRL